MAQSAVAVMSVQPCLGVVLHRNQPAVAQTEYPVEAAENRLVAGDDEDRRVLIESDAAQEIHDGAGACGIERRGRLVGENDARPIGERARWPPAALRRPESTAGIALLRWPTSR